MSLVLIDDQGELWDGSSWRLRQAYDTPHSQGEFSSYVVRNLGFVAASQFGNSCQVRLRPSHVSVKAVLTLLEWLELRLVTRFVASWYEQDWNYELFASKEQFLRKLYALLETARMSKPGELLSRTMTPEEVRALPGIAHLLQSYCSVTGTDQDLVLPTIAARLANQRVVLTEPDREAGCLRFSEIGARMFSMVPGWRQRAIGSPLVAQPDAGYGHWVNEAYESVYKTGEPRLETVDAIVAWPEQGRSRLRYRRLILPYSTSAGERCVLGCSFVDDGIDLRVEPAKASL